MSLGTGLGKVKGKVFRIGHLGDFNDLTLMGTLSGVEMGLVEYGVKHRKEAACRRRWTRCARRARRRRARRAGRKAA
jgi:alanine-glyoxylate transaminase / serine-glyoxylate transaminase / serine-pyruvate transaminase